MKRELMRDKMAEGVAAMGVEEAVKLMMERDRACRNATTSELSSGHIFFMREVAVVGCGMLGITVKRSEWMLHIEEVIYPVSGYFKDALKEREPVSVPGLGEDVGSHGIDPCDQAILNRGGGLDLGTFSFEEWVNGQ